MRIGLEKLKPRPRPPPLPRRVVREFAAGVACAAHRLRERKRRLSKREVLKTVRILRKAIDKLESALRTVFEIEGRPGGFYDSETGRAFYIKDLREDIKHEGAASGEFDFFDNVPSEHRR